MSTNYRHVEQGFLKLLEAIMKGHVVTINGESYRYIRKDDEVDRVGNSIYVATQTGFFKAGESVRGGDVVQAWLFLTGDLGWFEKLVKSATKEELAAVRINLAVDSERREIHAERMISALAIKINTVSEEALRTHLMNDGEAIQITQVALSLAYDMLQEHGSFPVDRDCFMQYQNKSKHMDMIIESFENAARNLANQGILRKDAGIGCFTKCINAQ